MVRHRLTEAEQKAHRKEAAECFNGTWRLLLKKRRSSRDELDMIHMAHASRYHWGRVGRSGNLAVGEWQVSRVYAVLRRSEAALYHANASLSICRGSGLRDFYLAFAYEALARASAVAGKRREARRYLALGHKAAKGIKDDEDREIFEKDMASIRI